MRGLVPDVQPENGGGDSPCPSPIRELVFGPMPEGATARTHVAAGAWCFAGREGRFPGWDAPGSPGYFPLPLDPYPDAASIAAAAKAANGAALPIIRALGEELFGPAASAKAVELAVGPFALLACHMLAERQQRVLDLLHLYGSEALRVELLPEDITFSFDDSVDFMLRGVQDARFNQYVYSRIVEALAPPLWVLAYREVGQASCGVSGDGEDQNAVRWILRKLRMTELSGFVRHATAPQEGRQSFRAACKDGLRRMLRNLPFPNTKGFSSAQVLFLSLAVFCNRRKEPDRTLDFSLYCDAPLVWRFPAEQLIRACVPMSLRSGVIPALSTSAASRPGPLRGMTPAYAQDERYRLRLAKLLAEGYRLFDIQHGANYGNLLSVGGLPFEYSRHCFFTWGWSSHAGVPANARPLPHPALCRIADRHRERHPRLILVGTEMSSFAYRLKSRPQSGALPAYRHSKRTFLHLMQKALHNEPTAEILYRPYFAVAGGLEDGPYIQRQRGGIALCTGDLTAHMLSCRLLVLDHYGTTLHMALAANTPCIAFWKPEEWGMEAASEAALALLREAGIVHDGPESAAAKAMAVWSDVAGWWGSAATQAARRQWLRQYANIYDAQGQPLTAFGVTKLWFSALRGC